MLALHVCAAEKLHQAEACVLQQIKVRPAGVGSSRDILVMYDYVSSSRDRLAMLCDYSLVVPVLARQQQK